MHHFGESRGQGQVRRGVGRQGMAFSTQAVLLIHMMSMFSKGAETTDGDLAVRLGV